MAKTKLQSLILVAILLISALLRLYKIDAYMEFLGDQGRDLVLIRDFLKNGNLFFIGPQTSIGNMYLGPWFYYFIAPSLLLSLYNPVGPSIFIALLGILTVYLTYRISSDWFNPKAGLISAFLMAISPVVIKYSSFSWNPNIMPLFSLLFVYFIVKKHYLLASLSFVMVINSHYLGLLLLPLALLIVIIFDRPIKIKNFISPIIVFIASLIPQILFDIKHHGQIINALLHFFLYRETTVNLKAYKALPQIPILFNQLITRILGGKNEIFGLVVSITIVATLTFVLLKKPVNKYLTIVLLWIIIGLVGLGLYKQHIYDHYFGFLFPAIFLMSGYLLSKIKNLYITLLAIAPLTYFSFIETPIRWSAPKQMETTQSIVRSILESSKDHDFNFALLAKTNYDPGYLYYFYENNSKIFRLDEKITDQLFVVCEPHPDINCQPINHPEWSVAAFGWAKISNEWEINGIKIFHLIHNNDGQSN